MNYSEAPADLRWPSWRVALPGRCGRIAWQSNLPAAEGQQPGLVIAVVAFVFTRLDSVWRRFRKRHLGPAAAVRWCADPRLGEVHEVCSCGMRGMIWNLTGHAAAS